MHRVGFGSFGLRVIPNDRARSEGSLSTFGPTDPEKPKQTSNTMDLVDFLFCCSQDPLLRGLYPRFTVYRITGLAPGLLDYRITGLAPGLLDYWITGLAPSPGLPD